MVDLSRLGKAPLRPAGICRIDIGQIGAVAGKALMQFSIPAALAAVLCAATTAQAETAAAPSIEEVMSRLGYTEADRTALLAGKIVTTDLKRTRKDQLIAAAAMRLPVEVKVLWGNVRAGNDLKSDPGVKAIAELRPSLDEKEWQELRFEDSERKEAIRLLKFRGGKDFNLSTDEIGVLRKRLKGVAAGSPDMLDKVSAAYRETLMGRYQAYLKSGLAGIPPYQQGKTKLHPAKELSAVVDQAKDFLTTFFPVFWKAFSRFPEAQDPKILNKFYWIKRDVEGRPDFVLVHAAMAGGDDYVLMTRREFFVGHTYESLQVVALALPTEEGVAVFYVNAAFTDAIALRI